MIINSKTIFTASLVFIIFSVSCKSIEKTERNELLPAHHTKEGFRNPHSNVEHGFKDFLKWQFNKGPVESEVFSSHELPVYKPDIVNPDLNKIHNPNPDVIQVTWIGHATFLIQVNGINILSDPMFGDRSSPVSFAGPKRYAKPGVTFSDLPEIHAVIISHDHYDHLDKQTIKDLGNKPLYFVPLKVSGWFNEQGLDNVVELDWWQSHTFAGVEFNCVPSQHFSGRSPFSRNETLWCGWVIETGMGNIFFAGDTGYSPDFVDIGKRFGKMRVSMLPIGAYKPRWFMGPVHVDPPEAIQIHKDVNSELSIGMHWGTFSLADEYIGEPALYLKRALKETNVDEGDFIVMKFGETRVLRNNNL